MALGSGSMLKTRNTSEILGLTRTSFFSEYQTRIQKVGEYIFVYCNNGKFDYTSRQHGGPVSQACAVYTSRQHGQHLKHVECTHLARMVGQYLKHARCSSMMANS